MMLDQEGRMDEAIAPLRRALGADPQDLQARQMLIRLELDKGHFEEARVLLAEGRRLHPELPEFTMALARLNAETGDGEAAIQLLQAGLRTAHDDAQYHGLLAALLVRAQRFDEAVPHYLLALRSDPANGNWLVGVGVALEAVGRPGDAAEAYRRADATSSLTAEMAAFVVDRIARLGSGEGSR
jgi:MSHA biogenesis protein MshN